MSGEMSFSRGDGAVLPVIIVDSEENAIGWGITNTKGYNKSIERSQAWLIDGTSGRLLPAEHISGYEGISDKGDHYEIIARSVGKVSKKTENKNSDQKNNAPTESGQVLGDDSEILAELEALLRQRKRDMPEGSYTTHLFDQGEEKIRKKTGEEAVELILARDNGELASEGADLIYHMMVLFTQRGMSISDCLAVLAERHR